MKSNDIYRYMMSNYHFLNEKGKNICTVDFKHLENEIYDIIMDLNKAGKFKDGDILQVFFINTTERKSKYIFLNNHHYILIDMQQIIECAWGAFISLMIDNDIFFVVSVANGDNNNFDINMSRFVYLSNQNLLKARVCICYNLANICFSNGYVDAAVKNLCSVKSMLEGIGDNDSISYYSSLLFDDAKNVGIFVFLHELTHYMMEYNKNSIHNMNEYKKLMNLIRMRYESGYLSRKWREYASKISSTNNFENLAITDIFQKLKINEKYPKLLNELKKNILSWKELIFEPEDWDLYTNELICDIKALNIMYSLTDDSLKNPYSIAQIIRVLLIQETFSLQNDLLMYITGKQKYIKSHNIKRAQLIFAALVTDYYENKNSQEWKSIINIEYKKEVFDDLISSICNTIEVIHETFYIVAIKDFCNSLLSEEILHKHINCISYLNDNYQDFIFTDDYNGKRKIYTGKHMSSFDAILLQKHINQEYDKFINYIFNKSNN